MTHTTIRNTGLRHILSTRRREMQDDVHGRIREGCTGQPTEARDAIEHADAGFQEEMELALLQMRSDMLIRVDEALLAHTRHTVQLHGDFSLAPEMAGL